MIQKGEGFEVPVENETDPELEEPGSGETATDEVAETAEVDGAAEAAEARSLEEAVDHLKRLQAEFDNFRKRVNRERMETVAWVQRDLVEKLLPVIDDFDRAVSSLEGESSPAAEGMSLIRDKLMRVLTESGLERIETSGVSFDPDVHEALMTESVEADLVEKVVAELAPGYRIKGKLVRPAQVTVGVREEE
jgi:molecular chaperone GrpE